MNSEPKPNPAPLESVVITTAEAERIINEGIDRARAFLRIGCDSPHGTPLREEMRQATLDALSWANDDDVIDALYYADMRNDES